MIIPCEPPGDWASFLKRHDNKNLPISEVKKKYLTEKLNYETFITTTLNNFAVASSAASGGPPPSTGPYNPTIYYNARLSSPPEGSFTNFSGSKTLFAHFPALT